jgi:hypothetical protein
MLDNNKNLSYFPKNYQSKTIALLVLGSKQDMNVGVPIYFDNDIELNDSTILGIRVENNFLPDVNLGRNIFTYNSNIDVSLSLTFKDVNNKILIDKYPVSLLIQDLSNVTGVQTNFLGSRNITRFNFKCAFDKGFVLPTINATNTNNYYLYLTIYYKRNGS